MSGFLNAAIKDDYKVVPLRPKRAATSASKARAAREGRAQASERAQSEKIARAKEKTRAAAQAARDWLTAQPKAQQELLLAEFESTLTKAHLKADLKKYGLEAPLIEGYFVIFIEAVQLLSLIHI